MGILSGYDGATVVVVDAPVQGSRTGPGIGAGVGIGPGTGIVWVILMSCLAPQESKYNYLTLFPFPV